MLYNFHYCSLQQGEVQREDCNAGRFPLEREDSWRTLLAVAHCIQVDNQGRIPSVLDHLDNPVLA